MDLLLFGFGAFCRGDTYSFYDNVSLAFVFQNMTNWAFS